MRMTILLGLLALLLSSACSDDTGILVKTKTAEGFTSPITHLRFYVGENIIDDSNRFADEFPLPDVDLSGRDLAETPYKLLIRPKKSGGANELVAIGVMAFNGDERVGVGFIPQPLGFVSGSVTEWEIEIDLAGGDFLDGPNRCFKWMSGMEWFYVGTDADKDCDGTLAEDDCNDFSRAQRVGRREQCDNGIDDNCDGLIDGLDSNGIPVDIDGDTFDVCGIEGPADCDDSNELVNPGATEVCNGIDDDCNNLCDEGGDDAGEFDADLDGVTICGSVLSDSRSQCTSYNEEAPDCAPDDESNFPGNVEIADGIDNNCSGVCDDGDVLDSDGDGFTTWGRYAECSDQAGPGDCDTSDGSIHPGAQEFCDGIDSDCDGQEIRSTPCFDSPNVGYCVEGTRTCDNGQLGDLCEPISDPANLLPSAICQPYKTCQAGDPFVCVVESLGTPTAAPEICVATSTVSVGCGGGEAIIVPLGGGGGGTSCTYQLVGGTEQQGYRLSLFDTTGGAAEAVVNSCQAILVIDPNHSAGDATISIIYSDGLGVSQQLQVQLSNVIVANCDDAIALDCSSWQVL